MKDRKYLLFILPIMVFLGTFLVIRLLDTKSYAINTDKPITATIPKYAKFRYTSATKSKNTYSHYIISHNSGWASGTKKLTYSDDSSISVVAYCAEHGKSISTKNHTRYALNDSKLKAVDDDQKTKLNKMMQYAYPYVPLGKQSSDSNTLKYYLNSIGGLDYTGLKFNDLTVQEAITAVQASIWNIIGKTSRYEYDSYKKSLNQNSGTEKQFNSCSGYYGNGSKILTSEEEEWYQEDGCSSQGDFYKYVFKSSESEDAKKRINALINWYTNTLQKNNNVVDNSETFEIQDSPSFEIEDSSYNIEVTFKTNMTDYDVTFKDTSGRQLEYSHLRGNTYRVVNVPRSIKTIEVEAVSNSVNKTVYWYSGSGQDFIGVDISNKNPLSLEINYFENPGTVLLYKVTGASQEVEVVNERRDNACDGPGQPTCLSGAKFALYYGDEKYLKQYIIVQNGKFEVSNLVAGDYYLKEIEPPLGYDYYAYGVGAVDSEGYIKFTISPNGNTVTVIANNQPTNICIKKVSNTAPNEVLEGARLVIEDEDGQVFESFTSSKQDPSGSNGIHCVSKLPVGSYYLTETDAPAGFSLLAKPVVFNIGKVDNVATSLVTVTNRKGLTMSKSDLTDGECVAGATLTIKDVNGNTKSGWTWQSQCINEDGTGSDSKTVPICLTEEEKQSYGDENCLEPGKYTLTEEIHPEGYATAETIEFEIDSNGKVIGDANMKDAPIEVCIYKVKKGTKEVLTGAEFEIYNKESAKLYTKITSSKEPCIPYFPVGEYVIKETKAPDGYKLPEINETTIIVEDKAGHQNFYIENEIIAPKTAMDYSVTVVIIASVFLMFGIGLVGYYEYKKGH